MYTMIKLQQQNKLWFVSFKIKYSFYWINKTPLLIIATEILAKFYQYKGSLSRVPLALPS